MGIERKLRPKKLAAEMFAEAMGMSLSAAEAYLKRVPTPPAWEARTAELEMRGEVALAEATEDIDDIDMADALEAGDPTAALDRMVNDQAWRRLRAQIGAHTMWSRVEDRTQRTAKMRAASPGQIDYWMKKIDPDERMSYPDRLKRAESAKRAHFLSLSLKSAEARRRKASTKKRDSSIH